MPAPNTPQPPRPTLYVVAVSHLDTQWRWTLARTIREFLPRTVRENRQAFRDFPRFVLSFEGAFRYRLLREHEPELFAAVAEAVAAGRWYPAGAAWEAMDCVLPSPESLLRQILHGQRLFVDAFGRRSGDLFLPDCFGFPVHLPTVAAHAGVPGFSTQKLRLREQLRAAAPIPFPFGIWEGPDGSELVAALDPGGYGEPVTHPLDNDPEWIRKLRALREAGQPEVALLYTGIGDQGGALPAATLRQLEASATGSGPVHVVPAASEQIHRDLSAEERARLPRYRGELLLAVHATGGYTSQRAIKRWNSACERLGDLAERASAVAAATAGLPHPGSQLAAAWQGFLPHQMHDTLCGTAVPAANRIAWRDQHLALARQRAVLGHAAAAACRDLDTRVPGQPLVFFNPHPVQVEEPVELTLPELPAGNGGWRLVGPTGEISPVQELGPAASGPRLLVAPRLPPLSFSVWSLEPGETEPIGPVARADGLALDNGRLHARLDEEGNLAGLSLDGRELLAAPLRFELLPDRSRRFPAWEILYDDLRAAGETLPLLTPAVATETGPVRAALRVERRRGRTRIRQEYRLAAAGSRRRLELLLAIDWWHRGRLLKLTLQPAWKDGRATFWSGLAAVDRGPSLPNLYEVPAQGWADLSSRRPEGEGLALLFPGPHGLDHPDPGTLRLTLVRTPAVGRRFRYQIDQDLGSHAERLALYAHTGDWREGGCDEEAERFRLPPVAFVTEAHPGRLGRIASLAELVGDAVALQALKLAEESPELVWRLRERTGRTGTASLRLEHSGVTSRAVDATEEPLGPETPVSGPLSPALAPFGLVSFTTSLPPPLAARVQSEAEPCRPVELPGGLPVASCDGEVGGAGFDGRGRCFPAELVPARIVVGGVAFELARDADGRLLALVPQGEEISLPAHDGEPLELLLAAIRPGRAATLRIGDREYRQEIPAWREPLGHADQLLRLHPWLPFCRFVPGRELRADLGWVATHLHDRRGRNLPEPGALFRWRLPLRAGDRRLTLPRDGNLRIVAASLVPGWLSAARPVSPLPG